MQALSDLMHNIATTTENVGGIPFGISLLLFLCLFWESRYIPRIVSGLGLFAFAIWIALYFASLVFPGNRGFPRVIPVHLLPANGYSPRRDWILAAVVCSKEPRSSLYSVRSVAKPTIHSS